MSERALKKEVHKREIKFVWHFTRFSNLVGIFSEGLLPRQKLEERDNPPTFNDDYRYDQQLDAVCCSIGHPNYKMFYALRQEYKDVEWVVLGIKPSVLWEKECAFCVENAASNNVTCIPINQRKGISAFNKLFEEIDDKPSRKDLGISRICPTNPQAEILILDSIEPEYIMGAICQSRATATQLENKFRAFEFKYHRALFSARKDYEHWR